MRKHKNYKRVTIKKCEIRIVDVSLQQRMIRKNGQLRLQGR